MINDAQEEVESENNPDSPNIRRNAVGLVDDQSPLPNPKNDEPDKGL